VVRFSSDTGPVNPTSGMWQKAQASLRFTESWSVSFFREHRALLACALAMAAGFALRRPLARLPENTLKFAVGVMLSAFGVFWTGEGLGVPWPGEDFAILGVSALFLVVALTAVALARRYAVEALA
jgi:uncharacterized membrane protein